MSKSVNKYIRFGKPPTKEDLVRMDEMIRKALEDGKDPCAVLLGRKGGLKGGKARAKKLSPKRRSEIAKKAARVRWDKTKNSLNKQEKKMYQTKNLQWQHNQSSKKNLEEIIFRGCRWEEASVDEEEYRKELARRQEEHRKKQQEHRKVSFEPCLHDSCPECCGTGRKVDGTMCAHMLSCPCPKCTPGHLM